jgi:alpha/beta superfamily hydrolase
MLRVACQIERVRALVGAGVPVSKYDFEHITTCAKPKLFVQGALDEFGPAEDIERLFARLAEPKRLKVIEGADHFFEGRLEELSLAVKEFIKELS